VPICGDRPLEQKVVGLIATDQLAGGNSRRVTIGTGGVKLTLRTEIETVKPAGELSRYYEPTVPGAPVDRNLVLFEGYNPGAVLPGVAGAICLLLALFAFQVLPVNYAGLALIILGTMLVVAEAFVPSFGTLGVGGLIAFVIGSIMLFDTSVPGFEVAMPIIGGIAFVAGLLLCGMV
jgi:membrane-bound serine protease (ClpP class)